MSDSLFTPTPEWQEILDDPFYLDEPKSITPSGYFGNGKEWIGHIDNFLTDEEIDFLRTFMRENKTWDITESRWDEDGTMIYDHEYWEDRVATWNTIEKADPRVITVLGNAIARVRPHIEEFFNVKALPTKPALVKWYPGQQQHPHADKELHIGEDAGKPNLFPHYDLATLFYINDDYEGGELYFPVQDNLQFRAEMGGAYYFPGDLHYIHGVTPIESGERFTCPFFWTITELKGEKVG